MSKKSTDLGNIGEKLVASFLGDHGFVVLELNYRTRLGEIDIIAQKDDLLVFVEVKTRRYAYFPIDLVVTKSKQIKIIKATKQFLLENHVVDKVCRFDVATIVYKNTGSYQIDYIENAFLG